MKFAFEIYQRPFKQPLRTSHGIWRIREGIIISLSDRTGATVQGEIAPLPWFGSETMSQALDFCQQLGNTISAEDIAAISDDLRACQFAFESAWLNLIAAGGEQLSQSSVNNQNRDLDFCYLLPPGEQALTTWKEIYQAKLNTTFKWKVGVYPLATEIEILQRLVEILPSQIKLRLDANGGLSLSQAHTLLKMTDSLTTMSTDSCKIEFVEQPLPTDNFAEVLQLSQEYSTLLALDESVASFRQLQAAYQQGWRGVFVIKAAIMGFPSKIQEFCQDNSLDIVFSSVFETEIGRKAVLRLAQALDHPRALGFGVNHWISKMSNE